MYETDPCCKGGEHRYNGTADADIGKRLFPDFGNVSNIHTVNDAVEHIDKQTRAIKASCFRRRINSHAKKRY